MNNIQWTNYHSHTNFCDGSHDPEDYILKAIQSEMLAYGFSSHAPVPFDCKWCMKGKDLEEYVRTVKLLKTKYEEYIEIYCGLEIDYIPGFAGPGSALISSLNLDYKIGSVHFVHQFPDGKHWEIDNNAQVFEMGIQQIFNGDVEAAVKSYYGLIRRMVEEEKPNIVGHLDKIKMHNTEKLFFDENSDWYKKEVIKTLDVIKENNVIVEINTRGLYKGKSKDYYPGIWVLQEMKKMGIAVTISSDAHRPEEIVLGFPEAYKVLVNLGFTGRMAFLDREWQRLKFR